MQKTPFFSVIIPTYNRAGFLKKAIESVLNQTYYDLELIVVDDGSCDETGKLVSGYRDKRIIYKKLRKNHGVSHARNVGIEIAAGGFIAFLDSDDWYLTNKLEKTFEYIRKCPEIKIFHTEETWYRNGRLFRQKKKHTKPTGNVYKDVLPICCISVSTAVIKKEVFDDIGLYDESLEACEDYDFWLRSTNKYEIKLIPEYLTEKDGGHSDQLSSSVWGLDRFRIKALEKMLSSGCLSKTNYGLTLSELKKKCKVFALGAKKHVKLEEAEYYKGLPDKYTS